MLVLITYDVNTADPAGRTRLRRIAKQCVNYGQRVQNSVFECLLDASQCRSLQNTLCKLIDPEKDSLLLLSGQPVRKQNRALRQQARLQSGGSHDPLIPTDGRRSAGEAVSAMFCIGIWQRYFSGAKPHCADFPGRFAPDFPSHRLDSHERFCS